MGSIADFHLRLSGGSSNTAPGSALGGAMSTHANGRVLSQAASALSTLTGVTIDDATGNALGTGQLFFDVSAGTLRWTPPGGASGTPVVVSGADGRYAILGASGVGALLVTVAIASLPSADITNSVTITNQVNKIFDDVSKAEALAGDTEYRGLFVQNKHATDAMVNSKIWIATNTPGQDNIQVALADEAKNLAIETIADESTAPSGPAFSAPSSYDTGLALDASLAANDYQGFWVRRVVPALVSAAEAANTFRLGFRIYV